MSDVNDFLFSGGAKSFPFENIGDVVRGTITHMEKRQQTGLEDNKPLFWDDGSPRMLAVFTLQTALRDDPDDDGLRSIYAKGGRYEIAEGEGMSMKDAIAQAVRDAKAKTVELGDELAVGFTGRAKAKKGYTAAKLYAASFRKGTKPMSADDLFDDMSAVQ
ncbi:MAG TPA: hypothetical protein VFQ26_01005 [Nitrospiraceae bacterium]|nr:hypothetical protein [Nitrospiraceae bacterium]